jgi:hypothetical protein
MQGTIDSDLDLESKRKVRDVNQRYRRYTRLQRAKYYGFFQSESDRKAIETRILSKLIVPNAGEEVNEKNPVTCDFLLSLFCAALFSYRRASVCDPVPVYFISEKINEKNFGEIELCLKHFLDVHSLSAHPRNNTPTLSHESNNYTQLQSDIQKHDKRIEEIGTDISFLEEISKLSMKSLMLLDWIINPEFDGLSLKCISLSEFKQKFEDNKPIPPYLEPNYVFEITYKDFHDSYERFCCFKQQYRISYGYHGSPLENIHSILRNGLDVTYAKESSLYGAGIYLSTDRDVAFNFLKYGQNFVPNSRLGDQLGCLVCCEILHHPDVKFSETTMKQTQSIRSLSRPENPRGYVVVPCSDYVLIKYVLVYCNKTSRAKKKRNFFQIVIFFYLFILLFIWYWKSSLSSRLLPTSFSF